MARVKLTRHVAADPASVALLLAGPAGSRETATLTPPRRTGVGFTASIELVDSLGAAVTGDITVEPAADAGSVLCLVLAGGEGTAARSVEHAGASFLSELALRARSRSYAA